MPCWRAGTGHLTTLIRDGSPHVTPVWVDHGGYVLVDTSAGG
ncbi:MAG: hypothetical protein QW057_09420 [Candidatus Bathyarchaeia archaeon]